MKASLRAERCLATFGDTGDTSLRRLVFEISGPRNMIVVGACCFVWVLCHFMLTS